ncbi:hypothetical protein J6590_034435 [Homalodisca vitripennis]|nr:hypothetical protein J6590_034435 [Homalodisca vitripennis]
MQIVTENRHKSSTVHSTVLGTRVSTAAYFQQAESCLSHCQTLRYVTAQVFYFIPSAYDRIHRQVLQRESPASSLPLPCYNQQHSKSLEDCICTVISVKSIQSSETALYQRSLQKMAEDGRRSPKMASQKIYGRFDRVTYDFFKVTC